MRGTVATYYSRYIGPIKLGSVSRVTLPDLVAGFCFVLGGSRGADDGRWPGLVKIQEEMYL